MTKRSASTPTLSREIGLVLLTLYGLGTILGAGIYVLVGKVAANAGMLAPLAFVVAAIIAAITGLSYCQLVINYPKSAGEVSYIEQGFRRPALSNLTGYLVVFTGVVSAATLANGFSGYLSSFMAVTHSAAIIAVVVLMTGLAIWGIAESLWLAAVITVIEVSGLFIILAFNADVVTQLPSRAASLLVPLSLGDAMAVMSGAFLAFYAFIGFEDMVNIVEEVKQPERIMPKAIVLALSIATVLYLCVAVVAVLGLPLEQLEHSSAPLRELLEQKHAGAARWVGVISLFAIVNGVLIQIIMASRVLFGMAQQQRAPKAFGKVSARTRTPVIATVVVGSLVLLAALWLPLVTLAKTTSFIILVIFTLVNVALWRLRKRDDFKVSPDIPHWPRLGAVLCVALLLIQVVSLW